MVLSLQTISFPSSSCANRDRLAMVIAFAAALAGCSEHRGAAPPRAREAPPVPRQSSLLAVPIDIDTNALRDTLDRALPRVLWTIDEKERACVKPQRVKLFGKQLKVTPPIGCRISGTVTRGAITLRGGGQDIIVDVPVSARIGAYDVGGVLKGETATGAALVHAVIRLSLGPDWSPRAQVSLDHDWTRVPGIDFLGQRITFTEKADEKLAPVIAGLERSLPQKLARMNIPGQVETMWRQGFTSLMLNRERPPVWMRITPQKLRYGGYEMRGSQLRLNLGIDALTETFVGARPPDPATTRLPALAPVAPDPGLRFHIPVVADYGELQPVILRALQKRAQRPIVLPGVGEVDARFDKVIAYGTRAHRIAVGVTLRAKPRAIDVGETRGLVWLVARPVNAPGSAVVAFKELQITGGADGVGGNLLLQLGQSEAVAATIAASLTQNFTKDLDDLRGKISRAIADKEAGGFVIRASIARFQIGTVTAYGQGLYLPVEAMGTASVVFRPRR